jgi:pheromone a factor receptor
MSRYFRLMALAATHVFFIFPVDLFGTFSHLFFAPRKPWISWADTHQHLGQVRFTSHEVFSAQPRVKDLSNLARWEIVYSPFLFFMFFGLSSEARQDYKRIFWRIATPLGLKPPAPTPQDSVWYA